MVVNYMVLHVLIGMCVLINYGMVASRVVLAFVWLDMI
jgi:hypothetical protein